MPREFLPISKIKEKLQNLLPKKDRSNSDQGQQPPDDFSVKGANLLDYYKNPPSEKKDLKTYYESPTFVTGAQIGIVFVTLLFFVVSSLNLLLDRKIKAQRELLSTSASQLEQISSFSKSLRSIGDQIEALKQYENEYKSLTPAVKMFLESRSSFTFESFQFNSRKASFSGTTPSPLTFSFLTQEYLQSGIVDQIVLRSASLNRDQDEYQLSFEVYMK